MLGSAVRAFIHRNLEPVDRLGEVLFGLIMALGFTGAVRLGMEEPNNRDLFISIFGCNLAWGIVDGVMFAMTALFERGHKARFVKDVVEASTEQEAMGRIGEEFGDRLSGLITAEERERLYRQVLELAHERRGSRRGCGGRT